MPITMGALATATLMGARPKDTNKPVRILTPQLSSVLNVPGLCWGWMPESPVFFSMETWEKSRLFTGYFGIQYRQTSWTAAYFATLQVGLNPKP